MTKGTEINPAFSFLDWMGYHWPDLPWYQDLCQEWRKYGNDTREEEDCDDGDDYDDNDDGDDDDEEDDDGDQCFKMMMLAV